MKLAIFPSQYDTYQAAKLANVITESPHDELTPVFTDSGLLDYFIDIQTIIETVIQVSNMEKLVFGTVIHDVFWSLESLITYVEEFGVIPEHNFPESCEGIAKECNKRCGLVYEVFAKDYTEAINFSVSHLPNEIQQQVITLAKQHGYDEGDAPSQVTTDSDYDEHPDCVHGFPENCCPLGCDDA